MTSRSLTDLVRCESRPKTRDDVHATAEQWLDHYDSADLCSADTLSCEETSAVCSLLDARKRPDWQTVMKIAYAHAKEEVVS